MGVGSFLTGVEGQVNSGENHCLKVGILERRRCQLIILSFCLRPKANASNMDIMEFPRTLLIISYTLLGTWNQKSTRFVEHAFSDFILRNHDNDDSIIYHRFTNVRIFFK